jgi:hypothetical protein
VAVALKLPVGRPGVAIGSRTHRSGRYQLVVGTLHAQHGASDRHGINLRCVGLVEHPEEKLEEGAARLGSELVEHRASLRLWNAIETQDAGKVEVGIDHCFPEGTKTHQVLP